jgi:hypothetical protein
LQERRAETATRSRISQKRERAEEAPRSVKQGDVKQISVKQESHSRAEPQKETAGGCATPMKSSTGEQKEGAAAEEKASA